MDTQFKRSNVRLLLRRLNVERLAAGEPELTQEDIADLTGVSRQTVVRWMKDTPLNMKKVRPDTIKAFKKFFGVKEKELLTPSEPDPDQLSPAERELAGAFSGLH